MLLLVDIILIGTFTAKYEFYNGGLTFVITVYDFFLAHKHYVLCAYLTLRIHIIRRLLRLPTYRCCRNAQVFVRQSHTMWMLWDFYRFFSAVIAVKSR